MSLALLTNKTFLMRRNEDGVWENFIDITKYPQVLGEAEIIDLTRIHDTVKRYITGLVDAQVLAFEANYTKENYAKANDPKVTDAVNDFRLCFGNESGVDGCWGWSGRVSSYVAEGQSNGIRKLVFIITDEGDTPLAEVANVQVIIEENGANGLTYFITAAQFSTEENEAGGLTYTIGGD